MQLQHLRPIRLETHGHFSQWQPWSVRPLGFVRLPDRGFASLLPGIMRLARTVLLLALLALTTSCEDTDLVLLTEAGVDAVNAVTLSDEDVRQIAEQAAAATDAKHAVAPPQSPHSQRLQRLISTLEKSDIKGFDFKIYLADQVNAFAMADGTVRIYSKLMDVMNDEELLFVIGHEIGHVVKKHSRKKVVVAYASSALRKGLASQQNEIGQIARSTLGALAQQLTNAQFSQHEEREADSYGAAFLTQQGYTVDPAVSALKKLGQLGGNHSFLSSHPDPSARAARLASGEYLTDNDDDQPSLLARLFATVKRWVLAIVQFVLGLL